MRTEQEVIENLKHLRWLKNTCWDFFVDEGKGKVMQAIIDMEWILEQRDEPMTEPGIDRI